MGAPCAWHLEAWLSFANNVELEKVSDLLVKMLQLCHVEPTPELRVALQVAQETLQDAEMAGHPWCAKPLEVIQALEKSRESKKIGVKRGACMSTALCSSNFELLLNFQAK